MGKGEREVRLRRVAIRLVLTGAVLLGVSLRAHAQATTADTKPSMEIYGFAMLDIGPDFKQIHQTAVGRGRVRARSQYLRGRAPEPARRQVVGADGSR
jgi:hypothetical protein